MSTAARRHTISNTTQPMEAAMAMVEEVVVLGVAFSSWLASDILLFGGVVSGGVEVVVSGGGSVVVFCGGGAVMMVSGGQSEPSP